ncbi:hypothetical protein GO285_02868 [Ralstonia solanacearum]|nr:hypothetical protein [Ralstonia solanacearum]NKA78630.1 hypothetical protein [Ralstonia solanacearum]NKG11128.1 hypothetical protein [Ralstonia solanacearum]
MLVWRLACVAGDEMSGDLKCADWHRSRPHDEGIAGPDLERGRADRCGRFQLATGTPGKKSTPVRLTSSR